MTKAQCVKKFRAAASRFVRAERDLDKAGEEYDRIRDLAFKNGWKMPRTVLTNPLAQKR